MPDSSEPSTQTAPASAEAARGELPIAPSMEPTLIIAGVATTHAALERRVILICAVATLVGLAAGLLAQVLIRTIWLITNLSFHGAWSFARATPPRSMAENSLGIWLVAIPVIGAAIIGLIARFGSRQVAGHGIPEAMEQVLRNQSRIPPRLTFLKPLSAAISIGTGGPFGAEGPIIATGGALGSLIGQSLFITAAERKTLLAAGASAGIAAAFGSPVAAVLLAIELLLFEFRPRSIVPVAFACAAAASIHYAFEGSEPFFAISGAPLLQPTIRVLVGSTLLGALMGGGAIGLTRAVGVVEHAAEKLPVHWMWRPAVGAVFVGVIGYFAPYTLGSGYFNIDHLLSGQLTLRLALTLFVLKFLSWTISLGSGTAGGTLAPVFTIGGALGAAVAIAAAHAGAVWSIDPRLAAVVGMVSLFAGASRAMLTCVAFAFETTLSPAVIAPVLCGCAAAQLVASLLSRSSIMSEKMHRGGVRVPTEYDADPLEQISVREACTPSAATLQADMTAADARAWIRAGGTDASHQGYPIIDAAGHLAGVLTRRDILAPTLADDTKLGALIRRLPVVTYDDRSLREAIDHMVNHDIGRMPVLRREADGPIGILTRADVLRAYGRHRSHEQTPARTLWE